MTQNIRPAALSDMPYLYEICLKTAANGGDATDLYSDPWLVGQYFAAPYLANDPSACFVAELDGVPRGYIVGTTDTASFERWMRESWLPLLKQRYPPAGTESGLSSMEQWMRSVLHEEPDASEEKSRLISEYPAHLHIDLLPELQGMGTGKLLIRTFMDALKKRNCPGLHLSVSKKNERAVAFYEKTGFSVIADYSNAITMGMRF